MFAPFFMQLNIACAVVLFMIAIILAMRVSWELSWKRRWMLIAASLLVAMAVGFCMMSQFWIDVARVHTRSHEYGERVQDAVQDPRLDEICRTAMKRIPEVSARVADEPAPVLDVVSYEILTGCDLPYSLLERMPADFKPVREVTLVYAVGTRQGSPTDPSSLTAGDTAGASSPERLYFRLQPNPWHLVRVATKQIVEGAFREVPLWDEAIDRQEERD